MTRGATRDPRVGILVVYYLRSDEDLPILQLHLDRIARHTQSRFTVYAAANRVSAAAIELLDARPWVQRCQIPESDQRGSREHGYYLDALADRAWADGMDRIVTLDVDSFPIADDWMRRLDDSVARGSGVAGILRTENGDSALPHPSCTAIDAAFFARYRPSFSPDSDFTPEFRRFLRATHQAGDTGLGLARVLWSNHIEWTKLYRTNAVDLHPVIAGVYLDCIFHLAGVASGSIFRRDLATSSVHRLTDPLERIPLPSRLGSWKQAQVRRLRAGAERSIVDRNRGAYRDARERLLADPDGFFAYLRGSHSVRADHYETREEPQS